LVENRQFFHTPLYSTPQLGGSRWNSATPFCTEKLEWLGYHVLAQLTNVTDGRIDRQTDRHRMPAIAALCIASHGKNCIRLQLPRKNIPNDTKNAISQKRFDALPVNFLRLLKAGPSINRIIYKKLSCRREAAQCFVFVVSFNIPTAQFLANRLSI